MPLRDLCIRKYRDDSQFREGSISGAPYPLADQTRSPDIGLNARCATMEGLNCAGERRDIRAPMPPRSAEPTPHPTPDRRCMCIAKKELVRVHRARSSHALRPNKQKSLRKRSPRAKLEAARNRMAANCETDARDRAAKFPCFAIARAGIERVPRGNPVIVCINRTPSKGVPLKLGARSALDTIGAEARIRLRRPVLASFFQVRTCLGRNAPVGLNWRLIDSIHHSICERRGRGNGDRIRSDRRLHRRCDHHRRSIVGHQVDPEIHDGCGRALTLSLIWRAPHAAHGSPPRSSTSAAAKNTQRGIN